MFHCGIKCKFTVLLCNNKKKYVPSNCMDSNCQQFFTFTQIANCGLLLGYSNRWICLIKKCWQSSVKEIQRKSKLQKVANGYYKTQNIGMCVHLHVSQIAHVKNLLFYLTVLHCFVCIGEMRTEHTAVRLSQNVDKQEYFKPYAQLEWWNSLFRIAKKNKKKTSWSFSMIK